MTIKNKEIIRLLILMQTTILIAGPTLGFSIFMLGTITTGGIYYRPDSTGTNKFTLVNLKNYMIAPFNYKSSDFNMVWATDSNLSVYEKLKLLQMNWLFTTGTGLLTSLLLSNLYKKIIY